MTELGRHLTFGSVGMAILVRPLSCFSRVSTLLSTYTVYLVQNAFMWPAPYGAITQLYAGTTPEGSELSGQASTTISP